MIYPNPAKDVETTQYPYAVVDALLVENIVLVELKVAKAINEIHRAQCLNYLKATGLHLCLLLNLDKPRPEIKRIVLDL